MFAEIDCVERNLAAERNCDIAVFRWPMTTTA